MTINIQLSTESINSAISKLKDIKENINDGLEQLVDILANEGAEQANSAYGEFPVETVPIVDGTNAQIMVYGDVPAIAEFGAGDATTPGNFENPPAEARPGSYSEQNAQQYSRWGFWYFAGGTYTEVPGHHGLLKARDYIVENAEHIAKEVIYL